MIAMALACRPSLVVADKPTTALDVMVQAQVLDVLDDLVHRLGVGMLLISHDLSVLAASTSPGWRRRGRAPTTGSPGPSTSARA